MNKLILSGLVLLLIIGLGPIIGIWALNTLFPILSIPYTIETWAAMAIFVGMVRADATKT